MKLHKTRTDKILKELKSNLNVGIKKGAVTSDEYILVYELVQRP